MTMLVQELIRRKRDGATFEAAEIESLVRGITDGEMTDAQAGALAMAMWLRGLDDAETAALTASMARSGAVLRWPLDRPVVDKHSTGGVGDKVSLMLAPIVAACGGAVPMIAGRALGHTGGTIDKLEAIPGYTVAPGLDRFQSVVRDVGCAIIGQTADLAPADGRLYAIRDTTGTVESIRLITASILSKKLAAGVPALVMDVKTGSGAFMPDLDSAQALARSLQSVGVAAGLRIATLISDMNQVLGHAAGNAVETREALDYLTGARRDARLHMLTLQLAASMLVLCGLATAMNAGLDQARQALDSGAAAEHFARMVAALGGPADLLQRPDAYLPRAPVVQPVWPDRAGVITAMDVRRIGLALAPLGGMRRQPGQTVDLAVGFTDIAGPGDSVGPDRPLAYVHARDASTADAASAALRQAILLGDAAQPRPLFIPSDMS